VLLLATPFQCESLKSQ